MFDHDGTLTAGEKDIAVLKAAFAIVCARGLLDWDGKAALHAAIDELQKEVTAW